MGQEHKEYTWNLIAKKLAGEATPEELLQLESLLRNNPELHYPLQTITDLWNHTSPHDKDLAEKAFSVHVDRMADLKLDYEPYASVDLPEDLFPRKKSPYRRLAFIITPILILVIGTIWLYSKPSHSAAVAASASQAPPVRDNEIFTNTGSRTHVNLPDGSKVWLNAGSRIDYGKEFGVTHREVELTGEAFFDVAPNPNKPFVIHTKRIDILVLGTSFNVKSYPTDKTTETTLIRGSIEVSIHSRPSDKIILKPNEKLVISNEDSIRQVKARPHEIKADQSLLTIQKPTYYENTGTVVETSWVDNKLVFQDEAFSDLARKMERWYSVTIRFDSPRLEQLQFTGTFEKETIQQALEALKLTDREAKFKYTVDGTVITIHN
jgi:ferric-dicitrate binding protein FerR (iron transport regulator)